MKNNVDKITKTKLANILDFTLDIAFEAGEILLKYQRKRNQLKVIDKGSDGIASEADEQSEKFILEKIKKKYPDHFIISEEDQFQKADLSANEYKKIPYTWMIDPLDGTNNFMNGIPIYCVSIGLLHFGKSILGVVYNPATGECFYASEGQGAFMIEFHLNPFKRKKLRKLQNNKEMNECIFSPSPDLEVSLEYESQLTRFKRNILGARAVRRLGSAALELCYVANGNFDGYWEKSLKPWDVAAASIICEETGVKLTDFYGNEFHCFIESTLAAASPLHQKILSGLNSQKK